MTVLDDVLGPVIDLRADLHGHVTDFACDRDRGYFNRHPGASSYVRAALAHELCEPGGRCIGTAGLLVEVHYIAEGVRIRRALAA